MSTITETLVDLSGVSKAYPGVAALRDVDFTIAAGEVRALLGKNGAGKSTLIKIIAGVESPDTGTMTIAGKPVRFRSPADGIAAGIATVHQELSIVPELSVAENIFLGQWPRAAFGIDWNRMYRGAREVLQRIGFDIDPTVTADRISIAQRQLVEIARALSRGARLLILDEPTSSLVAHEVDILTRAIAKMSASGVGVIYISHRIDEIRRIATSVTVLRDGALVRTAQVAELSNARIVEMMLGESSHRNGGRLRADTPNSDVRLAVERLVVPPRIADATFEVRAGEVLGIAGVLGSGRTELLQALAGLRRVTRGEMILSGRPYRPADLRRAMAAGVYMTPEDRRGQGAVTMLGVDENLVMASWASVSRLGVIRTRVMAETVGTSIRKLGIMLARPNEALANLSGGNQQKVVIGKALNARPRLLLLDEPTRGVDIGAKSQIYALMRGLADQGLAVVFVSGEIEEFAEVCDRVLVLRGGRITAELAGDRIQTSTLLDKAMGERREPRAS